MIVTHLDDVFVGGADDVWGIYLQSDEVGDAGRGWCIQKTIYDGMSFCPNCKLWPDSSELPPPPCVGFHDIAFQHTIKPALNTERCLPPHPMLDVPSGRCPCPSAKWICVRPSPHESVLRIQLDSGKQRRENVVLWSGDRRGVLEDVKVGTKVPRYAASLIRWNAMFLE